MNQTLEFSLLSMIFPATAVAIIVVLERRRRDSMDKALKPSRVELVVRPELRVFPSRKSNPH
jgi:hypothetical protein